VPEALGIPAASLPEGYVHELTISHGAKGWPAPGLTCDVAKPRTPRATLGAREWDYSRESRDASWYATVFVTRWAPGTADDALQDLAADRAWCAWGSLSPVDSPLNKRGESWLARAGAYGVTLVRRHGDLVVGVEVTVDGTDVPSEAQQLAVAERFERLQADRLD
jgi:hypothetical protein